ncbi:MAG: hypothetical protein V1672_03755 [Candidatus Diapherotrites archaeon]
MFPILDVIPELVGNELGSTITDTAAEGAAQLVGNPLIFVGGVVLILIAVLVFVTLKKILVNSVLGLVGWVIVVMLLHIDLPFIPSLIISAIFGLAGLGTLLLLRFFGLF